MPDANISLQKSIILIVKKYHMNWKIIARHIIQIANIINKKIMEIFFWDSSFFVEMDKKSHIKWELLSICSVDFEKMTC